MSLKKRKRGRQASEAPPDPIGEYREWADNRYNPGYWTGGRTPPSVKHMWSTKDRRGLGALSLAGGLVIGFFALRSSSLEGWVVQGFPALAAITLGMIGLFSRDNR